MNTDEVRPPAEALLPLWRSRSLRDHLDRELVRALPGSRSVRILDASCGASAAIDSLRARHASWSWETLGLLSVKDRPAPAVGTLPFDAGLFDAVLLCETAAACEQHEGLFSEVFRVLRPGGIALVNVPAHRWLASAEDSSRGVRRRFVAPALKADLSAAGFRGIQTTHWNALAAPALWFRRSIAGARPRAEASPSAWYAEYSQRVLMAVEHGWIRFGSRWPFGEFLFAVARKPLASDIAGMVGP